MQSIKDTKFDPDWDNYEVVDHDIRMIIEASERIIFYSLYMVDNVLANTSSKPTKDHGPIVDTDVLQNISRHASHYDISKDIVYVDYHLLKKNNVPSEGDMEGDI